MASQIPNKPRKKLEKNAFKNRISLLDECSHDSYINKSVFKGFHNLGKLIGILLIIIIPLVTLKLLHIYKIVIYRFAPLKKAVFSKPKFSPQSKRIF